jgi:putative CocE/NonD family hydrolase
MKNRLIAAAAVVLTLAFSAPVAAQAAWTSYDRPAQYGVVVDKDVLIPMRDGTLLYANVERPDKPGRYPVLVTQTPYGKDGIVISALGSGTSYMARRGYVVVTVDVRGTGVSQGTWDSFGEPEQRDGYDTVEWAARQSWSNGKVGLAGMSYMAITQLTTAALRPPHLRAIFPIVPMADGYRDIVFSGGDINVSFIPLWLGLVTASSITPPSYALDGSPQGLLRGLTTLTSHLSGAVNFQAATVLRSAVADDAVAYDSEFWRTRSPLELVDRINVPAFVVGGLHDIFQRGEPIIYERLKSRVPTRLLIGPWTHVTTGSGLPRDGVPSLDQIQLRWFDRWLKGIDTKVERIPAVTQYAYGVERYETVPDWPHPRLDPQRWHLRGGGRFTREAPKAGEAPKSFVQHPLSGICTMSTEQWTAGLAGGIPCTQDERPNELSGGVTYTSQPLERDLHVNGPIAARLWLTTTAADAAVSVRVSDVQPDGSVRAMTTGWQTASFRASDRSRARVVRGRLLAPWHPFTKESVLPVTAGEPTQVEVEVFPTDVVFRKGHRIRITIDPADFPHQVPPLPAFLDRLGGQVSILTDPKHASAIILPVVGKACARPAKRLKKARAKAKAPAACRSLSVPNLTRG